MAVYESDVCVIGGGITAALFAQKLTGRVPGIKVVVLEAGERLFDVENRFKYRQRNLAYGENPWPGDLIEDQAARGIISRTMAVGGSALRWQGHANRFSREDLRLRSLYGLAVDWPIEWDELERYYCEAERAIGVSGDPSPHVEDRRSEPYPMPGMVLTYSLNHIKQWAEKSGVAFYSCPQAKNTQDYDDRPTCRRCNTCTYCPIGARYSPDFTYRKLLASRAIELHDRTLVRKLVLDERTSRVVEAQAVNRADPGATTSYRAKTFVLASGYTWTPHLLLLSACARFPNGLGNSSGAVGRYMTGHPFVSANIEFDGPFYSGMDEHHPLISRQFFRCATDRPYARFDIQMFEGSAGHQPRLAGEDGQLMFGDALLADWRKRASRAAARVRMYIDSHPDRESRLTLDAATKNMWGDPLPVIEHRMDAATEQRYPATRQQIIDLYERMARTGNGKILSVTDSTYLDHPSGGCRMGSERATSVCDSYGRTHDHENLFLVGAPTLPTGGCTNSTMTFSALTLRSADRVAEILPTL